VNVPALTGVTSRSPGVSRQDTPSWPNPVVTAARFSGVRCTVIRHVPLHARATLHTSPCSSVADPSSTMTQGFAWWLVIPRRLVNTVSPAAAVSRRSCVSAPHIPVTWESR